MRSRNPGTRKLVVTAAAVALTAASVVLAPAASAAGSVFETGCTVGGYSGHDRITLVKNSVGSWMPTKVEYNFSGGARSTHNNQNMSWNGLADNSPDNLVMDGLWHTDPLYLNVAGVPGQTSIRFTNIFDVAGKDDPQCTTIYIYP